MSKRIVNTNANPPKVNSVTIRRPMSVSAAARGVAPPLSLVIEVQNPTDQQIFVWAKEKKYSYDSSTHTLSIQLAEPDQAIPPNIKMISDHPQTPAQVAIAAKGSAQIQVTIAPNVPRVVPGKEPGSPVNIVPDPIGQIDHVDLRVQYGTERIQYLRGEHPQAFRKRLLDYGTVVHSVITPTLE